MADSHHVLVKRHQSSMWLVRNLLSTTYTEKKGVGALTAATEDASGGLTESSPWGYGGFWEKRKGESCSMSGTREGLQRESVFGLFFPEELLMVLPVGHSTNGLVSHLSPILTWGNTFSVDKLAELSFCLLLRDAITPLCNSSISYVAPANVKPSRGWEY